MTQNAGSMVIDSQNTDGKTVGNIWVSDFRFARNSNILKSNGIGAIVSAIDLGFQYPGSNFKRLILNLEDQEYQDLQHCLDKVYDFIQETRQTTNILIHCAHGVSRSPALLIYYLMKKYKFSYDKALSTIRQKRRIVRPNKGFEAQLRKYQSNEQKH